MHNLDESETFDDEFIENVARRAHCEDRRQVQVGIAAVLYFFRLFLPPRLEESLLSGLSPRMRQLASVPRHRSHHHQADLSEFENRAGFLRNVMRESSLSDTAQALHLTRAVCAGIIEHVSPPLAYTIRRSLPQSLRELWVESFYHYELSSTALETFHAEVEHRTACSDWECIDEAAKVIIRVILSTVSSSAAKSLILLLPEEYRIVVETAITPEENHSPGDTIEAVFRQEQLSSRSDARLLVQGIFHALKQLLGTRRAKFEEGMPNDWLKLWRGE